MAQRNDIDEVLQISNVFINVSKGEVASAEDIKKAFGKANNDAIIKEILQKGELQVGDKERALEHENLWKELATLVSEKAVDPATHRPYPTSIIQKVMNESGFSIKSDKNAKSQVSACIKHIQQHSRLAIQRARMRVRVILPASAVTLARQPLISLADTVEDEMTEATNDEWHATILIDPSEYRHMTELLNKHAKGLGRIETLSLAAKAAD